MKIRKLLKTMVVTVILLIMCSVFFWGCDNKNTPDHNDSSTDKPTDQVTENPFTPFLPSDNVPVSENGSFYTLQEAFDLGYLTHEELQNIQYYNKHRSSIQYPVPLSPDVEETLTSKYSQKWDGVEISILQYCGTYNGAVAVQFDGRGLFYLCVLTEFTVDGVLFTFSSSNTIIIYK